LLIKKQAKKDFGAAVHPRSDGRRCERSGFEGAYPQSVEESDGQRLGPFARGQSAPCKLFVVRGGAVHPVEIWRLRIDHRRGGADARCRHDGFSTTGKSCGAI
jgi:hypothetical protein